VGFNALRIRRIKRHMEFLAVDDQLLLRDGLLGRLSEKELDEALEERGTSVQFVSVKFSMFAHILLNRITQGLAIKTKESRLRWWLESVGQSSSVTHRLLLLVTTIH
jgi:hypothetical protein